MIRPKPRGTPNIAKLFLSLRFDERIVHVSVVVVFLQAQTLPALHSLQTY